MVKGRSCWCPPSEMVALSQPKIRNECGETTHPVLVPVVLVVMTATTVMIVMIATTVTIVMIAMTATTVTIVMIVMTQKALPILIDRTVIEMTGIRKRPVIVIDLPDNLLDLHPCVNGCEMRPLNGIMLVGKLMENGDTMGDV